MTKHFCDRCEKEDKNIRYVSAHYFHFSGRYSQQESSKDTTQVSMHLCSDCEKVFRDNAEGLRGVIEKVLRFGGRIVE